MKSRPTSTITSHATIDFTRGRVVSLSNDWTTTSVNDNVEGFKLREGDFLHQFPGGQMVLSKTPKPGSLTSHLIQTQHELFGTYLAGEHLRTATSPTFVIKSNLAASGFTIASVAFTPWTVQHQPGSVPRVEPLHIANKDELKRNCVNRLFMHDPDANEGHICLVFGKDGIEVYFIDYAACFSGHDGKNYDIAMSGLGRAKYKEIWGHELIDDCSDPIVLGQLEMIENLPLKELKREYSRITEEIIMKFQLPRNTKTEIEENQEKGIEIIRYRKANVRDWIKEQKSKQV